MDSEYDVVIIGGAFSGAATALKLKRKRQEARVLIIEKTAEFDRKVGESMSAPIISGWSGLLTAIPNENFFNLPFNGLGGRIARAAMMFYNRRLVALAKPRWATGYYGRRNAGWRELYDGFVPDARLRKQIWHGLRRWWKCELINLRLMLAARAAVPRE
jgi:glycine/D-amino acid oxidase-like deaminating enzyme